jgi:dinuclear metal center YbgI/SA1388 family protein
MTTLEKLLKEADLLLESAKFKDYCPNGLQVEGNNKVSKLISGVTASQAFIERAIERGASALLVHHGCFWNNDPAPVVGMKHRRIKALLMADVSLLAYHLPLDAHREYGNNAQLAKLLDLQIAGDLEPGSGTNIGFVGKLNTPMRAMEFANLVEQRLKRRPVHIGNPEDTLRTIAWCSGAAQSYFKHAISQRVDAYLTGEISEQNTHEARENGIHYFAAGHHATERGGVMALGHYLANKFKIEYEFIEVDNPV